MYALIRVHIPNMEDGHPDVQVTIADLDENRESLEFRMMEDFAKFCGWIELTDFMENCQEAVEEYNEKGYLMYFDEDDFPPNPLDFWTIREV